MNTSSILSFVIAGLVLVGAVSSTSADWRAFLDLHAALVVFGGTAGAAAVSFQVDRLFAMFTVFFRRILRGDKFDYIGLIKVMMSLAESYRGQDANLQRQIDAIEDPFLKEGMRALTEKMMDDGELIRIMSIRAQTIYQRYNSEAMQMKSIAKFPPAFGLMSATLGMISLLQRVGTEEGQQAVGPAMAIALIGTLYGIAFSNMVLLPVAENLLESSKEVHIKNLIIVEGLRHIASKINPVLLAEELNSFLLASERVNWRDASPKSRIAKAS